MLDVRGTSMCVFSNGYFYTSEKLLLHRVVFVLKNKVDLAPGDVIDHVNRDTTDNRPINLRLCATAENTRNTSIAKTNKTSMKGLSIWYDPHSKKPYYQAKVRYNKKYVLNKSIPFYSNALDFVVCLIYEYQIRYHGPFICNEFDIATIEYNILKHYNLRCVRSSNDFY